VIGLQTISHCLTNGKERNGCKTVASHVE
jgi:hypothetical protein